MDFIQPLLLIVGGIIAISSLIIAKKPNAKAMIDKLTPYQAFIGVALLAVGLWNLLRGLSGFSVLFDLFPIVGLCVIAMIVTSILLGFLFGMPQIAKWIPNQSAAELKAMEFSKKVAPYQVVLGLIGIVASLLFLLIRVGLIKPF